ncbi:MULTISPECIES: pentapeptide repeat-containing protein [Actinoalloteichus]|uniref:pentapeptide repeat-containing protein n=1 Tax=Actinoalloteichus TaxID=65496 RepID=UPI001E42B07E|nr:MULTISPECIES: pentapeptide repeat-containing protein [Actinoalloteichus]
MSFDGRRNLLADCANCFALCCVALPFTASKDFAITKAAGTACPNLRKDFGCGIHADLRQRGFAGCTSFDCLGAGQRVSQTTFGGRDWRAAPDTAGQMFAVLPVMRRLHELLWYLSEALTLPSAVPLRPAVRDLRDRIEGLTRGTPKELLAVDLAAQHDEVDTVLRRTSELVRAGVPGRRKSRRKADLIGARLRGADLRGADLRGTYLIAADLTDADLSSADLIGADLRDARLHGANLADSLFLTQPQVNSADGDAATRLPAILARPAHW